MPEKSESTTTPGAPAAPPPLAYRVLARTWRPQRLSELIGQDALVRSLANAIQTGRVAHAFLLTGIRGVGKTTTARIIARALNCIGADGSGGPTPEPCGVCPHCTAIAEDRHIDVLEMDAATRTGIDDIREIVDSVRYAPTSARFKVYIIDEVHMLSEKAFNGLLKTLEEPPPQAKFIFATTEVRKVPVTILSRCQRFDLRRVEAPLLIDHLSRIAAQEGVLVAPDAQAAIARAAGGSVRDALSLLDQAIALGASQGAPIGVAEIHEMLGLADHGRVLDLFETLMQGDVRATLARLDDLYALGSEPAAVFGELLEISHWLTRLKTTPERATAPTGGEPFAARGQALAEQLQVPVLARVWQMLLKGLDEIGQAPDALRAAEMVLIRIAYAADLPPPAAIAALLEGAGEPRPAAAAGALAPTPAPAARPVAGPAPAPADEPAAPVEPTSFREAVQLFRTRGELMLHSRLEQQASLVRFAPGAIELRMQGHGNHDWPQRVAECLSLWTGRRWLITLSEEPGEPPLAAQAAAAKQARIDALQDDPRLQPVLDAFPGARIVDIRDAGALAPSQAAE